MPAQGLNTAKSSPPPRLMPGMSMLNERDDDNAGGWLKKFKRKAYLEK